MELIVQHLAPGETQDKLTKFEKELRRDFCVSLPVTYGWILFSSPVLYQLTKLPLLQLKCVWTYEPLPKQGQEGGHESPWSSSRCSFLGFSEEQDALNITWLTRVDSLGRHGYQVMGAGIRTSDLGHEGTVSATSRGCVNGYQHTPVRMCLL